MNRQRIELRDHRVGIVLAIWSIYTLVLGFLSPIVSNSCHLGGLVGGLILGALLPPAILADRTELARRPTTPAPVHTRAHRAGGVGHFLRAVSALSGPSSNQISGGLLMSLGSYVTFCNVTRFHGDDSWPGRHGDR